MLVRMCMSVCVERNGSHWNPAFCASRLNRYGTVMTYDIYFYFGYDYASRVPAGEDNLRFILQDELFSFRRIKLKRCKTTTKKQTRLSDILAGCFCLVNLKPRTQYCFPFFFGAMNCVFQSTHVYIFCSSTIYALMIVL